MLSLTPDELTTLVDVLFKATVIVLAVIILTRLNGLRSLSKQSAFDFPITVATGSLIASTIITKDISITVGVVAAAGLYAVQAIISLARLRLAPLRSVIDNKPLLLMEGDRIDEANLREARLTREDLIAKLRLANVRDPSQVRAVVFETTADVSVITGDPGQAIHPMLMENVRRG
jgi:uncharacterized membrane protein YcaP (DUF421 family)